jgi:hypothetical protein
MNMFKTVAFATAFLGLAACSSANSGVTTPDTDVPADVTTEEDVDSVEDLTVPTDPFTHPQ